MSAYCSKPNSREAVVAAGASLCDCAGGWLATVGVEVCGALVGTCAGVDATVAGVDTTVAGVDATVGSEVGRGAADLVASVDLGVALRLERGAERRAREGLACCGIPPSGAPRPASTPPRPAEVGLCGIR